MSSAEAGPDRLPLCPGLFGILVASAVGIAIPFLAAVEKRGSLFFLLRAFAGGVVLATGDKPAAICLRRPKQHLVCSSIQVWFPEITLL